MTLAQEVQKLRGAATPGPWQRHYDEVRSDVEGAGWSRHVASISNEPNDAALIAAAPLLAEKLIEALELLASNVGPRVSGDWGNGWISRRASLLASSLSAPEESKPQDPNHKERMK